jgi:O-antigen ligase
VAFVSPLSASAGAHPHYDRFLGLFAGLVLPLFLFGPGAGGAAFALAAILALAAVLRDAAVRGWIAVRLRSLPALLLFATLGWWALGGLLGSNPAESLSVVVRLAGMVLLALVLTAVLSHRPAALRTALQVFAGAFAALTTLAALSAAVPEFARIFAPGHAGRLNPAALFKSYTSVLALTLPLLLWLGWTRRKVWAGAAAIGLAASAVLLWGEGREPGFAGLLGLIAGLAAVGLIALARPMGRTGRRALLAGLVLASAAVAATVLSALPPVPYDPAAGHGPTLPLIDLHRQLIWSFAFEQLQQAPILGHGVNMLPATEGAQAIIPGLNQEYIPGHPHNWLLEIAAETGIPGLLLLLAGQLALALSFVRAALDRKPGASAAVAVMAGFWASSLVNFSIWSAWWQVAFMVALILAAAILHGRAEALKNGPDRPV